MNIKDLQKLAGINNVFTGYKPVDENLSLSGNEKRKIEKEQGIKPGDPEWFELWFSKPHLTGPNRFSKRNHQ